MRGISFAEYKILIPVNIDNRLSISFHTATDFNYKLTYRDRRMITQNRVRAHKLLPNYYDNADILKQQTLLFLFIVVYISRYIEE